MQAPLGLAVRSVSSLGKAGPRYLYQYIHATRRAPLGKATSVVARWNKLFPGFRGENPSTWSKTFKVFSIL